MPAMLRKAMQAGPLSPVKNLLLFSAIVDFDEADAGATARSDE